MQFAFKKINIEAPFETTQVGHACQKELIREYKDHLFARVFALKDERDFVIHFSLDLLALDIDARNKLQTNLKEVFNKQNLKVITSCTHTHYGNNIRDPRYLDYLLDLLTIKSKDLEFKNYDNLSIAYEYVPTKALGKSRISGYETNNEILGLIKINNNQDNLLNIIYLNCHPTTLSAEKTKFFSAEYPGLLLNKLEEKYRTNFTFVEGAAGDISSRFVRDGQDYNALLKLVDNVFKETKLLMDKESKYQPLTFNYQEKIINAKYENKDIDLSQIRENLSERELYTINQGIEQRKLLNDGQNMIFGELKKELLISTLDLNVIKLIFFPNEIFSEYMNYLNLDKALLVSYSNGYGPYVLPIDFKYLTYEMFVDTMSNDTKKEIINTLKLI